MVEEKRPLGSTRTFDTTKGVLTYAELADEIAPHLVKLLDDIDVGVYRTHPFDENLIQHFHSEIIGEVIPEIAGRWRKDLVGVGNWVPPEPFEVPAKMREFMLNLNTRLEYAKDYDLTIETLAYLEGEFLHIHPFQDFNGRTIRVSIREMLHRLDLPIVDTAVERGSVEDRKYRSALAEYDNGRMQALKDFWYERFSNLKMPE